MHFHQHDEETNTHWKTNIPTYICKHKLKGANNGLIKLFRTYFFNNNYGYHKQICIMGIKIRIYDNERYENFYDDIPFK